MVTTPGWLRLTAGGDRAAMGVLDANRHRGLLDGGNNPLLIKTLLYQIVAAGDWGKKRIRGDLPAVADSRPEMPGASRREQVDDDDHGGNDEDDGTEDPHESSGGHLISERADVEDSRLLPVARIDEPA